MTIKKISLIINLNQNVEYDKTLYSILINKYRFNEIIIMNKNSNVNLKPYKKNIIKQIKNIVSKINKNNINVFFLYYIDFLEIDVDLPKNYISTFDTKISFKNIYNILNTINKYSKCIWVFNTNTLLYKTFKYGYLTNNLNIKSKKKPLWKNYLIPIYFIINLFIFLYNKCIIHTPNKLKKTEGIITTPVNKFFSYSNSSSITPFSSNKNIQWIEIINNYNKQLETNIIIISIYQKNIDNLFHKFFTDILNKNHIYYLKELLFNLKEKYIYFNITNIEPILYSDNYICSNTLLF